MGFFEKIKAGLTKTRQNLQNTIGGIFAGFHGIDDDFYDELEESLILADLGVDTAVKAVERLREKVNMEHLKSAEEVREALKDILAEMLNVGDTALKMSTHPSVILVIGVNGVGKTTTIGKLAHQLKGQGKRCCSAQQIPSGPLRRTSWRSGLDGPGWISSASMKGQTLRRWYLMPSLPPRPEMPM